MKKKLFFTIIVAMFVTCNLMYGQQHRKLPIFRNFNGTYPDSASTLDSTAITYGGWSIQTVTGKWSWYVSHYNGNYYARCSGYDTIQVPEDQWFISPGFSTITYPLATLYFVSCDKFQGDSMLIYISTNYDGVSKPATATWTEITNKFKFDAPFPELVQRRWTRSGHVNLGAFQGNNVYVALRYTCDAVNSTDWEVDSIQIVNGVLGVNDINLQAENTTVYPNPAISKFTISNDEMINNIELFNMVGELVATYENVHSKIYTIYNSDLVPGLYIARIELKNGTIVSKKITKE